MDGKKMSGRKTGHLFCAPAALLLCCLLHRNLLSDFHVVNCFSRPPVGTFSASRQSQNCQLVPCTPSRALL